MSTTSDHSQSVSDAIRLFRQHLAIGHSSHTVEAYSTALNHFKTFLASEEHAAGDMDICMLSTDMALAFVHWMHDNNPVEASTLNNYLTAISRFYRWLMLEGISTFGVMDYARLQERLSTISGRRAPRPLPRVPTEETVTSLLEAAYGAPLPDTPDSPAGRRAMLLRLRNIALVEVLRSTGARVGEVVSLRRADLNYERQSAVVTGKGRKQRLVFLDPRAWEALTHYLQARADGASGRPLGTLPLFARHDRGAGNQVLPISTNTVRASLQALCQAAGLDESVTPHLLRHRFATKILTATGDLAATQDLLGHASPTTTRIYAKLTDEDTEDAHRRAQEQGRL
jgi:site-specific recombinase XerD